MVVISATARRQAMRDQGKIIVECTSCGRTTHAQRSPFDPPGLALTKTQCRRCNPGFTSKRYFNAQRQEIDCDGELLIRQIPPKLAAIGPTLVIVGTWIIGVALLVYFVFYD